MTKATAIFISWIVAYSIVTGILVTFQRYEVAFSLPIQTLILTTILVPLMVLVVAPHSLKLASAIAGKYRKHRTDTDHQNSSH
jgi:antibiotic biosynthesis monooxygenase (ABM) superfamily enzyme